MLPDGDVAPPGWGQSGGGAGQGWMACQGQGHGTRLCVCVCVVCGHCHTHLGEGVSCAPINPHARNAGEDGTVQGIRKVVQIQLHGWSWVRGHSWLLGEKKPSERKSWRSHVEWAWPLTLSGDPSMFSVFQEFGCAVFRSLFPSVTRHCSL